MESNAPKAIQNIKSATAELHSERESNVIINLIARGLSNKEVARNLRMNENFHGERAASEPQDRVSELIEQQTAISEVLRAIANSPHDLQPIFDAILDSATRLCRADVCSLRLSEESGLRLVALRGDPPLVRQASSFPALAEKGSHLSRIATSRL